MAGGKREAVTDFFSWAPKSLQMVNAVMKFKDISPCKKSYDKPSMCMLGPVCLFATLWTVACQTPTSVEFSRQEYWSGLLFPTPEDLPDPGIKPASPASPALAGGFFTTSTNYYINCFLCIY